MRSTGVVLAIVLGCGSKAPPAAPVVAEPAPAAKAEPGKPEELAVTVRMLVPGTAPRHLLRYKLTPQSIEYLELDMRLALDTAFDDPALGASASKIEIPTMRMTFKSVITEVLPSGDARIALTLDSFELLRDVPMLSGPRTMLENSFAQLAGMTGTSRLSPRGVPSEIAFDLPNATPQVKQMLESLRDSMRQMYVPLPADPVGKGAKWEVTARYAINGMMMDSKVTYLMTARSPDTLVVAIETQLSAPPQEFPLPGGMTGTITTLTGGGTGTLTQPLTRIVGTGKNAVTSDARFSVNDGSQTLDATMKTTVSVGVRPGKPAKP